jgi:alpha-tubulin suppressor-like RCC1 family protein
VGRLGHAEQKDEMVPRLIKFFDSANRGVRRIYCGSSFTLAIPDTGSLFLFGQNKKTGEANMYPKPVQDLAGEMTKLFISKQALNYSLLRLEHHSCWMRIHIVSHIS